MEGSEGSRARGRTSEVLLPLSSSIDPLELSMVSMSRFWETYLNLVTNQNLLLCQSCLGNWNHVDGLKMKTDQIMYPIWRGKLQIPVSSLRDISGDSAVSFKLEYKYIVAVKDNDNQEILVRWENTSNLLQNRCFYLTERTKSDFKILDIEGEPSHAQVIEDPQICIAEERGEEESPISSSRGSDS